MTADCIGINVLIFLSQQLDHCADCCADSFVKSLAAFKIILRNGTFYTYHISHQIAVYQPYQLIKRTQINQSHPIDQNYMVLSCHIK